MSSTSAEEKSTGSQSLSTECYGNKKEQADPKKISRPLRIHYLENDKRVFTDTLHRQSFTVNKFTSMQ